MVWDKRIILAVLKLKSFLHSLLDHLTEVSEVAIRHHRHSWTVDES